MTTPAPEFPSIDGTRLLFPETDLVSRAGGRSAAGAVALYFANDTDATPADIVDINGDPVTQQVIDIYQRHPRFYGPVGYVKRVFTEVGGGPRTELGACLEPRVEALEAHSNPFVFHASGVQAVKAFSSRLWWDTPRTIENVWISLATPNVGAPFIVDLLLDGTSVWSAHPERRPALPSGTTGRAVSGAPDSPIISAGSYTQIAVVQVGLTTAGSDLDVGLVLIN